MMYLIYNNDGSVRITNLNEIITQGSTTAKIFVAVVGYENTDYSALARYILPNKTSSAGVGVATNEVINGTTYKGWLFTLTQDETYYYGELKMSVEVKQNTTILFTINIELTINQSGFVANTTNMTITQYSNLISSLATKVDKTSVANRVYGTNVSSEQTVIEYTDYIVPSTIAKRQSNGNIMVASEPVLDNDATSKRYVDGKATTLYRHNLTIVGMLGNDVEDVEYNLTIINSYSEAITTESILRNQIPNSISFKGYILTETSRILDMYIDSQGDFIASLCYISGNTIYDDYFVSITSITDNKNKL